MAFEELRDLFEDEKPALVRLVSRHTGCLHEAEDIIQEAFFRALENAPLLDPAKVGGWLTTVARRLAVDSWRKKGQEVRFGEWPAEVGGDHHHHHDQSEGVLERELARAASKILDKLPPPQRDALLGVASGLSVSQIAEAKLCTARAVEGHLRRGRSVVRRWMAE